MRFITTRFSETACSVVLSMCVFCMLLSPIFYSWVCNFNLHTQCVGFSSVHLLSRRTSAHKCTVGSEFLPGEGLHYSLYLQMVLCWTNITFNMNLLILNLFQHLSCQDFLAHLCISPLCHEIILILYIMLRFMKTFTTTGLSDLFFHTFVKQVICLSFMNWSCGSLGMYKYDVQTSCLSI